MTVAESTAESSESTAHGQPVHTRAPITEHGNNRVLWSGYTWQYRLATRRLRPSEYHFSGNRPHTEPDTKTQSLAVQGVVAPQR